MVDKKFHKHNLATFVRVHAISRSPNRVINNQEVAIQLKPQNFVDTIELDFVGSCSEFNEHEKNETIKSQSIEDGVN